MRPERAERGLIKLLICRCLLASTLGLPALTPGSCPGNARLREIPPKPGHYKRLGCHRRCSTEPRPNRVIDVRVRFFLWSPALHLVALPALAQVVPDPPDTLAAAHDNSATTFIRVVLTWDTPGNTGDSPITKACYRYRIIQPAPESFGEIPVQVRLKSGRCQQACYSASSGRQQVRVPCHALGRHRTERMESGLVTPRGGVADAWG